MLATRRLIHTSKKRSGFSLVEVVLALAIVSFSLVGILSIFPVALDTASDSKTETRVTVIAQNIISDLQTSPSNAAIVLTNALASPNGYTVPASLVNFPTVYVAFDSDGRALKGITQAEFDKYTGNDASFLASVKVVTTLGASYPVPQGLALVNVSIQAPPRAANSGGSRKKYYFSAYLPTQ